jgi:hypothetical protein
MHMCEEKAWGESKHRELFTQRQSITSHRRETSVSPLSEPQVSRAKRVLSTSAEFTFSTRDFCTEPVRRKAGVCSLGSNSVIMTAAFSCCKIWDSQRWREQFSPKPRWYFKDLDFVQHNTWVLTFLQVFVEFIAFYYIISILTYVVPQQQIMLVATVYATNSDCVDHSQALKYTTLKLKIKYIER